MAAPSARKQSVLLVEGEWLLMYGGVATDDSPLRDLWGFHLTNQQWMCVQVRCRSSLHPC